MINTELDISVVQAMLASAQLEKLTQQKFLDRFSDMLSQNGYQGNARDELFNLARLQAEKILPLGTITYDQLKAAYSICRRTGRALRDAPWFADVTKSWPAPIAHEVLRLVEELEGRPYGGELQNPSPSAALLQLRDTYEVFMKTLAIIFVRALIETDEAQARWARSSIFRENASAGYWKNLLIQAAERVLKSASLTLYHPLATLSRSDGIVAKAFQNYTEGRNKHIGHGALALDPAETADVLAGYLVTGQPNPRDPRRVSTLSKALAAMSAAQAFDGFTLVSGEGSTAKNFSGAHMMAAWLADPRHTQHEQKTVPLHLHPPQGAPLALAPFMAGRICDYCGKRDVLLYDSVHDRNAGGRFDFLDYARGHHSRMKADDVSEQFAETELPDIPAPMEDADSLNDQEVIERLDRARVERNYLSPRYLRNDFQDFLVSHDRGIFWLQAPAHSGKTTFVQGIVEPALNENPIDLRFKSGSGGQIAAYYCKKEYRTGLVGLLTTFGEGIRAAFKLSREADDPEPSWQTVLADQDNKPAAFVAWVEAWRARARRLLPLQVGDAPLLIVIDGLDEADDPASGSSALDILPDPKTLPAGLFFLLTSRVPADKECPGFVRAVVAPRLAASAFVTIMPLDLDTPAYRQMLTDYIAHRRQSSVSDPRILALAERILPQAEYRFIYVSFLMSRVQDGDAALLELGTGDAIYANWLKRLDREYGRKQAERMRQVLAMLAAIEQAHGWIFDAGKKIDLATGGTLTVLPETWHGLPIQLLAILTGQDRLGEASSTGLAPALLATLFTLQGALGVWRGEDGAARYRLGLKNMLPAIEAEPDFAALLPRAQAKIATAVLEAVEHIVTGELENANFQIFLSLTDYLEATIQLSGSEIIEAQYDEKELLGLLFAIDGTLRNRANWLDEIPWLTRILYVLGDQEGVAQNMLGTETQLLRANDCAAAYMNRGVARGRASDLEGATADVGVAIKLMEAIHRQKGATWAIDFQNDLAIAYMNHGNVRKLASDLGGAMADYDMAIELMEAIRRQLGATWAIAYQNDLAGTLMNRGSVRGAVNDLEGAMVDYDAAIELRQSIRQRQGVAWSIAFKNDLAAAYMNRGNARRRTGNVEMAIADLGEAINLREAIRRQEGATLATDYQHDLANAYMSRGVTRVDASDIGGAIADFGVAIELMEAIRRRQGATWAIYFQNELAGAYTNLGNARRQANDLDGAIADLSEAIGLSEAIRRQQGAAWATAFKNGLAGAYMNRGIARDDASDWVGAVTDYCAAIELMQSIRMQQGPAWTVTFRNDLAGAFSNLAISLLNMRKAPEACRAMGEAATIWRTMVVSGRTSMPPEWRANLRRAEQFLEQNCGIGQL